MRVRINDAVVVKIPLPGVNVAGQVNSFLFRDICDLGNIRPGPVRRTLLSPIVFLGHGAPEAQRMYAPPAFKHSTNKTFRDFQSGISRIMR